MPEEKNKSKEHMFSGFFDNCRRIFDETSLNEDTNKIKVEKENITGEIAKLKLKKIEEILKA